MNRVPQASCVAPRFNVRKSRSSSGTTAKASRVSSQRRSDKEFEPWEVALCYHFVILCAAMLTLTCPVHVEAMRTWVARLDEGSWNKSHLLQAAALLLWISMAFFRVHGSDPGYLTVDTLPEQVTDGRNPDMRREYCSVCKMAPPLRSHHCRDCNICVATFDHHCGFVAACIGERNRCRFWWLLLAQAIGIGRCCIALWDVESSVLFSLSNWERSFWSLLRLGVTKVYVSMAAAAALFLLTLHTGMAITGSTTFECLKWQRLTYLKGIPPYQLPFCRGSLYANLQVYGCFNFCFKNGTSLGKQKSATNEWKAMLWKPPRSHIA